MILSVSELRKYVQTNESDEMLEGKLQALELLIRKYTNNNFQYRSVQFKTLVNGNAINNPYVAFFKVGDTIQISQSQYNDGLYLVKSISGTNAVIDKDLFEEEVLVTKVFYPMDIKMGVVNLMKWELSNRDKTGIQSETISRHSVTYFNTDEGNTIMGYPQSLMGFLKPYMKARF